MRFIGEFIQEFTSRFRGPVFLEDASMRIQNEEQVGDSEQLQFVKYFGSGPNGDIAAGNLIGMINFFGDNSNLNSTVMGQLVVDVKDIGANPTGRLRLRVGSSSTGSAASVGFDAVTLKGDNGAFGKVEVDILNDIAHGLCTIKGDTLITSGGTFASGSGSIPKLSIENNTSGGGTNNDVCGYINFRGKNNDPGGNHALQDMTSLFSKVLDVTPSSETAELHLMTKHDGTLLTLSKFNYLHSQHISILHEFNGRFAIRGLGSGLPSEPTLELHNKDTSILASQNLGQIDFMNDDDGGTTLQIKGVATEDHASGSNGGSKLEFYVTPDTTSSLEKAVTIGQDKSLTVEGDIIVNGNDIVFEGTSADAHEVTLSGGNPGSDITVTLPASIGTLALTSDDITGNAATATTAVSLTSGNKTINGDIRIGSNNTTTAHVIERFQVSGTNAGPALTMKAGTASGINQVGGNLNLHAGKGTGNSSGGGVFFYSSNASTGSNNLVQNDFTLGNFDKDGNLIVQGDLKVVGNEIKDNDDVACITFDSSGNTTIAGTTSGTFSGNLTGDVTGNAQTASSATSAGTAKNVAGNTDTDVNISSDKNVIVTIDSDNDTTNTFKIKNSSDDLFVINEIGSIGFSGNALTNVNTGATQLDIQTDGNMRFTVDRANNSTGNYFSFIKHNQEVARLDDSGNLRLEGSQLSNSTTASNFDIISSRILKLQHAGTYDIELGNSTNQNVLKVEGDAEKVTVNGTLNTTGLITGKQREVYSQSFFDDLGTTKHYLPWKDINEQLQIYQEEAAMLMPCDGRIVSVSVRVQFPNADGDITIGVHTCPVNVSTFVNNVTNNWIEEETELLSLVNADDNHLFHFAFDNAKHFESSELCTISIQCSADISGNAYWHITTVVEYDWNTFLGTTSAEIESTP